MADFTEAIKISLVGLTVVFVSLGLLMVAIQIIGWAVSLRSEEAKTNSRGK